MPSANAKIVIMALLILGTGYLYSSSQLQRLTTGLAISNNVESTSIDTWEDGTIQTGGQLVEYYPAPIKKVEEGPNTRAAGESTPEEATIQFVENVKTRVAQQGGANCGELRSAPLGDHIGTTLERLCQKTL